MSTGRDLTALVKPPRSLFVNHPMGNPFGRPDDTEGQTAVLRAALRLVAECDEAGALIDFPTEWGEPFEFRIRETPKDYQLKK
ncbi:MAG: hypothetical protein KDC18_01370 [Alphaproteobacteria bacterium]|nr:hypothetical protein [Alphaproteobacteria bacterium]MCB9929765.1 hypothetical protein [Alphaproteobacteria bacterium]